MNFIINEFFGFHKANSFSSSVKIKQSENLTELISYLAKKLLQILSFSTSLNLTFKSKICYHSLSAHHAQSMMGFLMVEGLRRMDLHWGHPYKQLPALKQSLAQIVTFCHLGATRYQAFGKFFTNTVLGIFCLSFFLSAPLAYAQSSSPSITPQIIQTVVSNLPTPTSTPTQSSTPPSPTPYPVPESINFQLPHPGYITTTFSRYHSGIDIATGLGMPTKPITRGIVTDAGYNIWGLGLFVEIDHGNGYKSLYAHMGKIYVTKGREVDTGDLIGEVGLTGNTSGPHTHLELSFNNQKIDPRPLLPQLRNYPKEEDFATYQSSTPSAIILPTAPVSTASATQTHFEDAPKQVNSEEDDKLTPEKISEGTLTNLLAENKVATTTGIPLTLTAELPKEDGPIFDGESTPTNLSIAINKSTSVKEKAELEKIATQNLTIIFNTEPQQLPTKETIAKTEDKTPTGGRITFDFLAMLNLR